MQPTLMARLIVMIMLLLGLTVPLVMIYSVVSERTSRRNEAAGTIGREWGGPQTVGGPVLTIPYRHAWRDPNGVMQERTDRLFVLPETLSIEGTVDPETRRRGLFEVVVYTGHLTVSGRFPRPDLSASSAVADDNRLGERDGGRRDLGPARHRATGLAEPERA